MTTYSLSCLLSRKCKSLLCLLQLFSLWGQHFWLHARWCNCSCFMNGHFPLWSFPYTYGQCFLPSSCLFRLLNAGLSIPHKQRGWLRSSGFLTVPKDKYFYIIFCHIFQWVYKFISTSSPYSWKGLVTGGKFQQILGGWQSQVFSQLSSWIFRTTELICSLRFMAVLAFLLPPNEIWAFTLILAKNHSNKTHICV